MNTNPLVSIVVPVYNAEDVILNCLNSVRNQSYKNLDIIVVDDKSTDGTANLVEKLCGTDKRIRIIRLQKNAGSSFARQCGLNLAHGEYVTFIDADDWYSNDMVIEKSLSVFSQNDVDIVMFNFMAWHFKRIAVKRKFKGHGGYYDSLDAIYNKFVFGNPHWLFLWNKIYRINFIRKNEINFKKGFRWADDSFFNSDILLGGKKLFYERLLFLHLQLLTNAIVKHTAA